MLWWQIKDRGLCNEQIDLLLFYYPNKQHDEIGSDERSNQEGYWIQNSSQVVILFYL